MDEYAEDIKKKLGSLPEDIQNFVYSADMETILGQISSKHHLHIDQIPLLESEVVGVLIGISSTNNFASNLAETLHMEEKKSTAIAQDVNNLLFVKIRESMKKASATTTPSIQSAEPEIPSTPLPVIQTAEVHPVDMTLAHTTITTTPAAPLPVTTPPTVPSISTNTATPTTPVDPSKPKPYSTDPYREPVE